MIYIYSVAGSRVVFSSTPPGVCGVCALCVCIMRGQGDGVRFGLPFAESLPLFDLQARARV